MHQLLLNAGIPSVGFSGHSIRKSEVVTVACNGISREELKHLGCWKSNAVDIYIDKLQESEPIRRILLLNARLLR
jgi:hypothetical protein